jgi:hypothetical protein
VVCGEDDEGKYAVTRIRKLGAVTLAAPLAFGFVAFGPGTAAQAARTGITSPADKAVITKGTSTTVSAHLNLLAVGRLFVDRPGTGGEQRIASGTGPRDISNSVDITRNGVYVVKLKGLLGETIDQQAFSVRVPPARPSGVDAGLSGNKLIVRWERGGESDITGYDVFVGGKRARQGSTGALCAEEVCSTALSVPASGGRTEVGVRAHRPDGSGRTIASKPSTASVLLPVSTAPSSRGLRGLPPQSASPLLPLHDRSPLTLPSVAPDGATPGFEYPAPAPQVANPPAAAPNAQNASSATLVGWGKSVAIALILLVAAAHLGMWTRRMRLAQAAAEPVGTTPGDSPPRTKRKHEIRGDKPDEAQAAAVTSAGIPPAGGPAAPVPDRRPPARSAVWPARGPLIDAKGPVADAAVLGRGGSSARYLPEPADAVAVGGVPDESRPVDDDVLDEIAAGAAVPAPAAGAGPRARTAAQDVNTRNQQTKGKRSARHSAGYRGRRRAD